MWIKFKPSYNFLTLLVICTFWFVIVRVATVSGVIDDIDTAKCFETSVNNNNMVSTKPQKFSCETVVNTIGRKQIKICTDIEIVIINDRIYSIERPYYFDMEDNSYSSIVDYLSS